MLGTGFHVDGDDVARGFFPRGYGAMAILVRLVFSYLVVCRLGAGGRLKLFLVVGFHPSLDRPSGFFRPRRFDTARVAAAAAASPASTAALALALLSQAFLALGLLANLGRLRLEVVSLVEVRRLEIRRHFGGGRLFRPFRGPLAVSPRASAAAP